MSDYRQKLAELSAARQWVEAAILSLENADHYCGGNQNLKCLLNDAVNILDEFNAINFSTCSSMVQANDEAASDELEDREARY